MSKPNRFSATLPKSKYRRHRKSPLPSVAVYLAYFVDAIDSGRRLNAGKPYAKGTVEAWRNFRRIYMLFDPDGILAWCDLDKELVARFRTFMSRKGFMPTTVNKYVICFRALAGYAYSDGVHDNHRALHIFERRSVADSEKGAEIYLTEKELDALAGMPLEGREEMVRDIFLVGCYTCQRVSDYANLTPRSFTRTPRGTEIIHLRQRKTGHEIKIPILNPRLKELCLKYDYSFPRVTTVELNKTIKEILCRLAESVPTLGEKVATRKGVKQTKGRRRKETVELMRPRWQLVSSHTARRSGITNLYLSGRFTTMQLMHISGHTTYKNFKQYIRLSADEIADEIAAAAEKEL